MNDTMTANSTNGFKKFDIFTKKLDNDFRQTYFAKKSEGIFRQTQF